MRDNAMMTKRIGTERKDQLDCPFYMTVTDISGS